MLLQRVPSLIRDGWHACHSLPAELLRVTLRITNNQNVTKNPKWPKRRKDKLLQAFRERKRELWEELPTLSFLEVCVCGVFTTPSLLLSPLMPLHTLPPPLTCFPSGNPHTVVCVWGIFLFWGFFCLIPSHFLPGLSTYLPSDSSAVCSLYLWVCSYFVNYHILPCRVIPMHNVHPYFLAQTFRKKIFCFNFLIQFFIYLYFKTILIIIFQGIVLHFRHQYCFLELHFWCISIKKEWRTFI